MVPQWHHTMPSEGGIHPISSQRFRPAFEIAVIPAVEGPTGNAQLVECDLGGQMRLLNDPDDLELLRGRVFPLEAYLRVALA
jgi:hypothetical protein